MATVLALAPLLVTQLFTECPRHPACGGSGDAGQFREVRGHGVVVRATAHETRAGTDARIEIRRGARAPQVVELRGRDAGAAMLLHSIEIVDANFDGHPDVLVAREFGAKWFSVDAFLFEPRTGEFSASTPLARAIGGLANATFDARHRAITTRDIGPSNPSRVTYTLDRGRLREIASCRFLNPIDPRAGTLVRKNGEHTTVSHVRLGLTDVDPCD